VALRRARLVILVGGASLVLVLIFGLDAVAPAGHAGASRPVDHIALDILPVRPGGPPHGYAAYLPSTVLVVPAHQLVSVTIRNFDLDPTPEPPDSPYARVRGTAGGVAYADGTAYTSLDRTDIAHTFTIKRLGLNVPIPGDSANGERYVSVTFRFRTGAAGAYAWGCFAPCGDGPDRHGGPMADEAYMRGTLFVQS
jgi:hypothetical protein